MTTTSTMNAIQFSRPPGGGSSSPLLNRLPVGESGTSLYLDGYAAQITSHGGEK